MKTFAMIQHIMFWVMGILAMFLPWLSWQSMVFVILGWMFSGLSFARECKKDDLWRRQSSTVILGSYPEAKP